jgi:predicted Zn-dependent protease
MKSLRHPAVLFATFSASLFLLWTCARNPVTGQRQLVLVSESQEIAMGAEAHMAAEGEYGFVNQPAVQTYVQTAGRKLEEVSHRPNLDWHFTVVDSPVINAFAIPGGYVYFTRGILVYFNTEAELAGVMGHEIAHVTARHSVSQMSRATFAQLGLGAASIFSPTIGQLGEAASGALGLWFLKFGRDDEREADRVGVEYSAKAGYDPREASNFFDVLRRLSQAEDRETIPGWLSTHPDPGERVVATREAAEQWVKQLGLTSDRMVVNRDGHLRNIDGIVFGDNPREGVIEGRQFYHPDLQFQITFPPDWRIENTRQAVYALDPQEGAQIQLSLAQVPQGTSAEAYASQLASKGLSPASGGATDINGNRAFVGAYNVRQQDGSTVPVLAAFIEYNKNLYEIIGAMADVRRYSGTIEAALRSFNRLTDKRLLSLQPDRVEIYTARQGDTLQTLAKRYNNPRVTADDLAILNRLPVDQPITPGRLVKVIAPGN